ncbi:MAG: HipA N-terminal domain-containing protein [Bacteroidetes bacterium]|nr:HipA N-terminal domain-containing protein [Bacteroidota bacterium]
MRIAEIYRNGVLAGRLAEVKRHQFVFTYTEQYLADSSQPAVSLSLPKTQKEYRSEGLFPFFSNMLSEGANKKLQSKQLRIDEEDDFGLLMATAQVETIGAVTVKPIEAT